MASWSDAAPTLPSPRPRSRPRPKPAPRRKPQARRGVAGGVVWIAVVAMLLAGTAAIIFAVVALTGASLFGLFNATSPEAAMALGGTFLVALLLILALMLPLIMAIWFAPPLVVFHELGAVESMKASFLGCLRNMLPFLLYGVVLLVAAIIASIPFMLGWLILGPVMAASIYTAYRDIYFAE